MAFTIDYLTLEDGIYHTIRWYMLENPFSDEDGQARSVDQSTAMDIDLIQEVFERYQATCQK